MEKIEEGGNKHDNSKINLPYSDKINLIQKEKVSLWSDRWVVLVLLIFFINQGLLWGYTMSIELRLTELKASNDQLTLFSYAFSPFSFKLFLAPFLDTFFWSDFGKRKSYIVPLCYASSLILLISAFFVDDLVAKKDTNLLFLIFFSLILLIAVKDMSVDGLSIKLLNEENVYAAGFLQRFGWVFGTLIGYNAFVWANSVDVSNKYFWPSARDYPIVTHKIFMFVLTTIYTSTAIYVHCFMKEKAEQQQQQHGGMWQCGETFKRIKGMMANKNLRNFLIILFFLQAGYIMSSSLGNTVLVREKKFDVQKLNMLFLICIPVTTAFMILGTYFSKLHQDLSIMMIVVFLRIPLEICNFFLISNYNMEDEGNFMYYMGTSQIFGAIVTELEFCAFGSFAFRIAENEYSVTIITTIYSVSNFSVLWPKVLAFQLYNYFTYWHICAMALFYQIIFNLLTTRPFISLETVPKEEWDPIYRAA